MPLAAMGIAEAGVKGVEVSLRVDFMSWSTFVVPCI